MADQLDELYGFSARLPYLYLHIEVYQVSVLANETRIWLIPCRNSALDMWPLYHGIWRTGQHQGPVLCFLDSKKVGKEPLSFVLEIFQGGARLGRLCARAALRWRAMQQGLVSVTPPVLLCVNVKTRGGSYSVVGMLGSDAPSSAARADVSRSFGDWQLPSPRLLCSHWVICVCYGSGVAGS